MAEVLTQERSKIANAMLTDRLHSDDPVMHKEAANLINEYIRTEVKEDSILDRIMEPIPVPADEIDRVPWTDKPSKIVDIEPGSPAAYVVGYAGSPDKLWLRGRRFVVTQNRIQTRRFGKDVAELRTWHMDLRQIVSDNTLRNLLAEQDSNFIAGCNKVVGTAGAVMAHSGVVQNVEMGGDITRESIMESFKKMQSVPNSALKTEKLLCNMNMLQDLGKIPFDEWGNNDPGDVMVNGFTKKTLNDAELIVTIKRGLVPDKVFYHFANVAWMGKHFEFEPTTMHVKKDYFIVEFFAYKELGACIANTNSVFRINHNG